MDALQFIKRNCNCCITGEPLRTSYSINIMQLHYRALWNYPVWGNIDKSCEGMAVAFFHDKCYVNGEVVGDVKFAVEIVGEKIVYHPISKLIKIDFNKSESYMPVPLPGISSLLQISSNN